MISAEILIESMLDSLYDTVSRDIDHKFEFHELIYDAYLSIERKILQSGVNGYFIFLNYHYDYFGTTYHTLMMLPDDPIKSLDKLNIELDKFKSIFKNHNSLINSDRFYKRNPDGDYKTQSRNQRQYLLTLISNVKFSPANG